jgi:hypothetical protein
MDALRLDIRKLAATRRVSRSSLDVFKHDLKNMVTSTVFGATQRTPLVISVVNIVGRGGTTNVVARPVGDVC